MKITLLLVVLVVGLLGYVRLAPSDPARWHIDPVTAKDPAPAGVLRTVAISLPAPEALGALDAIARAEPRTTLLAGSPDSGRMTYVARSRWVGFPDYITVSASPADRGSTLHILSRPRFGLSDMGVNGQRLDRWLRSLEPLQD